MSRLPDQFKELCLLYKSMDTAWDKTAEKYEFTCNGCEDNCCFSLFFHHTHVEKAFLLHGFDALDTQEKKEVLERAQSYCNITFQDDEDPVSQKAACPLLVEGQCRLYEFRPMICRMHGLPHEIRRPGHFPLRGPGCHAGDFDAGNDYFPFDRTPFYTEMAGIEMAFRTRYNKTKRLKETVAQILLSS